MAIAQGTNATAVNPTNWNVLVDAINANTAITEALSSELQSLTDAEIQQLQNIDTTTITIGQWAILGGLAGTLTAAELNYSDGVTSGIQAQLDAKALDADVLKKDGSIALTADWDAGGFEIRAQTFEADAITGTPPFTIASTTKVANLNVDQVDGYDLDQGVQSSDSPTFAGVTISGAQILTISTFADGDATPDVSGGALFKTGNTAPTSITTFDGGINGQWIAVIAGGGNTTIVPGTTLKCNAGANLDLAQYDVIEFVLDGTVWCCTGYQQNTV